MFPETRGFIAMLVTSSNHFISLHKLARDKFERNFCMRSMIHTCSNLFLSVMTSICLDVVMAFYHHGNIATMPTLLLFSSALRRSSDQNSSHFPNFCCSPSHRPGLLFHLNHQCILNKPLF